MSTVSTTRDQEQDWNLLLLSKYLTIPFSDAGWMDECFIWYYSYWWHWCLPCVESNRLLDCWRSIMQELVSEGTEVSSHLLVTFEEELSVSYLRITLYLFYYRHI